MATKTKWLYVALGATGALALVLGSAFAALTTTRAAADPAAGLGARLAPAAPGRNGWPGPGDLPVGDYEKALAAALGVSEADLDAAYQQAWEAALADALEQGSLTQAQADEMRDHGRQGRRGAGRLFGTEAEFDPSLAQALGVSVDALREAQTEALTTLVDQAVEDETLTQEQADVILARHAVHSYIQEAMTSAFAEAVARAVADGAITQAQADLLLSQSGGPFVPGGFGHGPLRPFR